MVSKNAAKCLCGKPVFLGFLIKVGHKTNLKVYYYYFVNANAFKLCFGVYINGPP